jgi:hypothetical protein
MAAAAPGLVAEVERLAQLLEGSRANPGQRVERLEADRAFAAQLEDLVRQLGADTGLDQLVMAGAVHVHLGHGGFSPPSSGCGSPAGLPSCAGFAKQV